VVAQQRARREGAQGAAARGEDGLGDAEQRTQLAGLDELIGAIPPAPVMTSVALKIAPSAASGQRVSAPIGPISTP
jgi:hypothetical protein